MKTIPESDVVSILFEVTCAIGKMFGGKWRASSITLFHFPDLAQLLPPVFPERQEVEKVSMGHLSYRSHKFQVNGL